MTRDDLDEMLTRMAAPLPRDAETAARGIAARTMPARLRRGRAPRARWVLPAIVVGGLAATTAGAGAATIAMSNWAGVEQPIENVRNSRPIPVGWTTEDGHVEQCRVWIEIADPEPDDVTRLDAAVDRHDWSGLGQRLYDEGQASEDDADGEGRVADALAPVLRTFAEETFPGIGWTDDGTDDDGRVVAAWGMTCAPDDE